MTATSVDYDSENFGISGALPSRRRKDSEKGRRGKRNERPIQRLIVAGNVG